MKLINIDSEGKSLYYEDGCFYAKYVGETNATECILDTNSCELNELLIMVAYLLQNTEILESDKEETKPFNPMDPHDVH